ncbi:MAG: FAD-dependent monooxygenase [Cyanobacterium sp.]
MPTYSKKIAIIGAGIGGLTLALALEKKGIDFHLHEQANSFEALGYGLQLSPNVVRVLQDLGIGEELEAISHRCLGFELKSFKSNDTLAQWKLKSDTPYYQCRRADLHQLLYNSLKNKDKISFAQKLQSYEVEGEQIVLNFENKNSITTHALVGADGVRSPIRQSLFPTEKPQYAGYAAYRAILPFTPEYNSLIDKATVWMGENHHVVAYPNGNQNKTQPWLNLVLVVKDAQWHEQGWTILADKQEIAENFQNQSSLLNTILKDLVSNPEPCFKWGLFDHKPLPFWTQGKITLLGDSAHPLLPFQAQGAAMAIEDAYILARCIDQETTIEQAFKKYQNLRLQRTAQVQQTSRNNADIFHATGIKAMVRDTGLKLISSVHGELLNQKTAWIYNYDPLTLPL